MDAAVLDAKLLGELMALRHYSHSAVLGRVYQISSLQASASVSAINKSKIELIIAGNLERALAKLKAFLYGVSCLLHHFASVCLEVVDGAPRQTVAAPQRVANLSKYGANLKSLFECDEEFSFNFCFSNFGLVVGHDTDSN